MWWWIEKMSAVFTGSSEVIANTTQILSKNSLRKIFAQRNLEKFR
jgi:hypothetical protein